MKKAGPWNRTLFPPVHANTHAHGFVVEDVGTTLMDTERKNLLDEVPLGLLLS